MPAMKQGSTAPIAFTTHDTSDNPVDATTLAGTIAVRVIKPGGTSVAGGGTGNIGGKGITQPDVTNAPGCCYYTPGATDLNTIGQNIIRISATGMAVREILIDVEAIDRTDPVRMGLTALRPDAALVGAVTSGTITAASFPTNLTIPDGQLGGEAHIRWLGNITATLAHQVQKISTLIGGRLVFDTAFSTAPAIGDQFVLVDN